MSETTTRNDKGQFVRGTSGNATGRPKSQWFRTDGWASTLTGIGTALDKRTYHTYKFPCNIRYQDLISMWRSDDLAARAIEGPPADAFRQGYELVFAEEGKFDKLKEEVEERLHELEIDSIVERAFAMERALGGCAILLGVDDGRELKEPLRKNNINGIEWLTLLEPMELDPEKFYEDPKNPKYGEPEYYRLNTYQYPSAGIVPAEGRSAPPAELIHESRLIILSGVKVSRYQINTRDVGQYWGDSVLIRLVDVLRDFNIAWQSAGIIVTDFSQSVFQIENLMQLVMKNPDALRDRMQAVELSRSTARAVLIDTKEKFDRQSTSVTGLGDLLEKLSLRLAAAVDMPLSLLMGQAPKGLGADSEGDLRLYYDKVRSFQRRKAMPLLKTIIGMVMKSMRERGVPKKWTVAFNPLWQLTDAEIAEARLTQARSDSMYVKMGVLYPNEIRMSRYKGGYSYETQIDENKEAPGFLEPLPPGVIPGSSPNVAGAKPAGPNAHSVGGYARRNPVQRGLGANTPEGGDVAPRTPRDSAYLERRDDAWFVVYPNGELRYDTKDEALATL